MRTRYGQSPWIQQYPATRRPRFGALPKGEHVADVVIIGAGLTGALTARLCARAGLSVLVLEADRVGRGAPGDRAGGLSPAPEVPFRTGVERLGLKVARQAWEQWGAAAADAAATLKSLKIPCGATPAETFVLPWRVAERELVRDHKAKSAAGLAGTWPSAAAILRQTKLGVPGARRTTGELLIDPYAAVTGVVRAAVRAGATVHEKTCVTKITFDRRIARVAVGSTVITTPHVVVTTNVATPETKQLRRHVAVRQRFHVLTEPVPVPMRKRLPGSGVVLVDGRQPRRRVRWTPDGRLLISGGDQKALADAALPAAQVAEANELMYETLLMYPDILGLRLAFGWTSTHGHTLDGLPCIGPHRFFPHHLLALAGSGDSLTDAFLASRILFRAAVGKPEKADDAFTWQRLGS